MNSTHRFEGLPWEPAWALRMHACLGYVEQNILRSYTGHTPNLFKRYIDDCVGASSCSRAELDNFITYISNLIFLEFTSTVSSVSVPFLDISVSIDGDSLSTSMYYKPTDSHLYVLFNSSHPQRCLESIPFSQFLRARRIC